jgi:hypothetical protein
MEISSAPALGMRINPIRIAESKKDANFICYSSLRNEYEWILEWILDLHVYS